MRGNALGITCNTALIRNNYEYKRANTHKGGRQRAGRYGSPDLSSSHSLKYRVDNKSKSKSKSQNNISVSSSVYNPHSKATKMLYPLSILSLLLLALIHLTHGHSPYNHYPQSSLTTSRRASSNDTSSIPLSTREYWMRRANSALAELSSPCPFAAFGTVIVNHTDTTEDARGKLVCMGVNNRTLTGSPILHGKARASLQPPPPQNFQNFQPGNRTGS